MASSAVTLFLYFLIFSLTSATEDQREIKAKPGDDVTLQCQSPRDEAIRLLEWSRPDLKEGVYVFFYRNKRIYENYQHPSFRGRVQLRDASMKNGNVSVILKNVNINDSGRYECHVSVNSNTEGREGDLSETNQVIQLTVTDSGDTAGNTWTEGNKDGRVEDGGVEYRYNPTPTVLSVILVILVLFVIVGLMILKKHKERMRMNSSKRHETENVLQPV